MVNPSQSDFVARNVEPVIEDILCTRQFVFRGGSLYSLTVDKPVVSGINEAYCDKAYEHPSPDPECTCGFYVYDSQNIWWSDSPENIKAIVKASGQIVVCDRGLRAEKIEILAITKSSYHYDDEYFDKQIREKYPNVHIFNDEESMFAEFPITTIDRPKFKIDIASYFQGLLRFSIAMLLPVVLGVSVVVSSRVLLNHDINYLFSIPLVLMLIVLFKTRKPEYFFTKQIRVTRVWLSQLIADWIVFATRTAMLGGTLYALINVFQKHYEAQGHDKITFNNSALNPDVQVKSLTPSAYSADSSEIDYVNVAELLNNLSILLILITLIAFWAISHIYIAVNILKTIYCATGSEYPRLHSPAYYVSRKKDQPEQKGILRKVRNAYPF